ncbi:beta-ketoacyl synthase [Cellulophaga baltica]|uniref:beta-ketoacyl synthase N-terminal-like domain-containing protein n=1 Tax=Cellulophaga TaxID=104264 RepID=UPI001C07E8BA|nr:MULTISPECIES: beta-ketoacyl synthase N-terminal-like domain-containing protein [Cellulophaga]MBU2995628.1 beta-ketoacyl synthase [Cellulophaga baltica]MDO6767022.1 beta-ketoacyl synthase N-terminal-like domain-containing protein [Cellulophaga sp. 1_MG-2023]
MKEDISITAISSISPLGITQEEIWNAYQKDTHFLTKRNFEAVSTWVGALTEEGVEAVEKLKLSDAKYKNLDDSVLFTLFASRQAMAQAGWSAGDNFGINIGSSRGATSLFEKYHQEYLNDKKSSTLASPTTTLGNISSWIAHDLQTQGPEISHSITCSTALHSLLNGVAWLKGGMADKFMVGGSEAPLTPFTIAQIKALKIYAREEVEYPCLALDLNKTQNTMVLGEGASVVCLEKGVPDNALAVIEGVGYATEILEHNISISTDAVCFQRSMKMALGDTNPDEVDVIVMHAPGTRKGDSSEVLAINEIFCNKRPFCTTNKWKIGHTFGASGMLSLELAVLMIQHQKAIKVPYVKSGELPNKISKVLVNAVGFGGNAVSILLKKVT